MAQRAMQFALLAAMLALLPGCGSPPPATLTERGLKELRSGQYDEAIATCTEAAQVDPRDDEAYLYRGRAYYYRNGKGDARRALVDFGKAIELDPKSSDAYYFRAEVYRDLGDVELAVADDKQARELDGRLKALERRLPDPPPLPGGDEASSTPGDASQDSDKATPESANAQDDPLDGLGADFGKPRFGDEHPDYGKNAKSSKRSSFPRSRPTPEEPEDERGFSGSLRGDSPQWDDLVPLVPLEPLTRPGEGGNPAADGAPRRVYRPTPTSPFQVPAQSGPSIAPQDYGTYGPAGSPFDTRVRSPFGQRAPAPTGFGTQPVGPFAPRSTGPQVSPQPSNPFSNPSVRPANPRDYIP